MVSMHSQMQVTNIAAMSRRLADSVLMIASCVYSKSKTGESDQRWDEHVVQKTGGNGKWRLSHLLKREECEFGEEVEE